MTVGIVTGAARGMGRACAVRMVDLVDVVLLVDRDESAIAATAADLAGVGAATVESFPLDISDRDGLDRLASRAAALGVLRAVAHAAGISPTMADWRQVLSVDLVGTARLVDALWPMTTTDTAVVCFASIAPWLGIDGSDPAVNAILDAPLDDDFLDRLHGVVGAGLEDTAIAYMWAKAGVHRLVRREAARFGQVGARICSVSPGIIDTPMGRQEAAAWPINELIVQRTPLGREGRSEEVAATVAFLLSSEASFVSGIDILVDGGVVASLLAPQAPAP